MFEPFRNCYFFRVCWCTRFCSRHSFLYFELGIRRPKSNKTLTRVKYDRPWDVRAHTHTIERELLTCCTHCIALHDAVERVRVNMCSSTQKKILWKENPEELQCINKALDKEKMKKRTTMWQKANTHARSKSKNRKIDRPIRFLSLRWIYLFRNIVFVYLPIPFEFLFKKKNVFHGKKSNNRKIVDRDSSVSISQHWNTSHLEFMRIKSFSEEIRSHWIKKIEIREKALY